MSPVVGNYKIPNDIVMKILKAEDSRDAAPVLEMLTNVNTTVRYRAALAAGRIGDERAVARLITLLGDTSVEVRTMAAFALGEIESITAADAVIQALRSPETAAAVRARLVEAAGKIAAANAGPANTPPEAKNPKVAELGKRYPGHAGGRGDKRLRASIRKRSCSALPLLCGRALTVRKMLLRPILPIRTRVSGPTPAIRFRD